MSVQSIKNTIILCHPRASTAKYLRKEVRKLWNDLVQQLPRDQQPLWRLHVKTQEETTCSVCIEVKVTLSRKHKSHLYSQSIQSFGEDGMAYASSKQLQQIMSVVTSLYMS